MHERLLTAAIEYDKGDPKRIQHFIKVHSFARLIGKQEKLSDEMMKALETAAILHDIGIHEGERLYGRNDTVHLLCRLADSQAADCVTVLSRSADMRMSQSV